MGWKIGRIFGIEVRLHYTFIFLLGWVALADLFAGGSVQTVVAAVGLTVCIFGIIVLHELGHALMARRFGVRTRNILLFPLGGVASLEKMPDNPRQELLIALCGPAVNAVLALLLFALLSLTSHQIIGAALLQRLAWINVGLGVFNLLPAFPLDGGRVLRALLARRMHPARATVIAARLGQGLAVALGAIGIFFNTWLVVIAVFVWLGAAQEAGMAQRRMNS